ncbi:DnaB-like helicase N-terminal domain-containing protein [Lolliginicoccus levis]|uniref:DnaB-like helicase N-terminal domain-containing protein n=1 Tax=Lolliginicoccus levis TaxID=2919542 RepID=UPI00241CC8C8|nr:DnaB-like helicase N-terminal domain-containing protein [Lolliginicoccus levis]
MSTDRENIDREPTDHLIDAADIDGDDHDTEEAWLLGALLWARRAEVERAAELLDPADFHRPLHAELFALIAREARAGRGHRPPDILAALAAEGGTAGHRGGQAARALTAATTSGADPLRLPVHAYLVCAAAARRATILAAHDLLDAAERAGEHELFPRLLAHGRAARAREQRMACLRAWSGREP